MPDRKAPLGEPDGGRQVGRAISGREEARFARQFRSGGSCFAREPQPKRESFSDQALKEPARSAYALPSSFELLTSFAIAAFLAWYNLVFRLVPGPQYSFDLAFFSATRADAGWLTAAATVILLSLCALLVRRVAKASVLPLFGYFPVRPIGLVVSAATGTVGGALLLFFGSSMTTQIIGGLMCGIAVWLMIVQVLSAVLSLPQPLMLRCCALGMLMSCLIYLLVFALVYPVSIWAVEILPALFAACLWMRARAEEPSDSVGSFAISDSGTSTETGSGTPDSSKEASSRGFSIMRTVTILLIVLGSSLLIGTSAFGMDVGADQAHVTQWPQVFLFAALITSVLLIVLEHLNAIDLLQACASLILATSMLLLPLSSNDAIVQASIVLNRSAVMCAFVLVAVQVDSRVDALVRLDGVLFAVPQNAHSVDSALSLVAASFACMFIGVFAGGIVHTLFGNDAMALTLTALFALYFVFLVVVVAMRNGSRSERVIVESVDEKEAAHLRCMAFARRYPDLSARELDVLELLLRNYSNARIAEAIGVSPNTVKTHVRHIFAKMGVNSRDGLLDLADKLDLDQTDATHRQ